MSVEIDLVARDKAAGVFDNLLSAVENLDSGIDDLIKATKSSDTAFDNVSGAASGASSSFSGMSSSVTESTTAFLKNRVALQAMNKVMSLAKGAASAVGDAMQEGIGKAVNLEFVTRQIEALADTTEGAAKESIMAFAASSVFSIDQVSASMYELAARGDMTQAELDKIMTAATDLAVATGSDLEPSVSLLAATLQAFGADADQASDYMVILTNAANASALEVEDIGQALSTVGALAHSVGISIEDVAAAMAIMSNKGIEAHTASTALRNAITRLGAPSGEAADQLRQMGVEIFDSEGNMKDLDTIMQILSDSMGTMSEQQRTVAMEMLFGRQSISAMSAVLGEYGVNASDTAQTISDLSSTFGEQAGVTAQLDSMTGSLQNQFGILMGSVENIQTTFGNALLDSGALQEGITALTSVLADPAIVGAISSIGDTIGKVLLVAVKALTPVLDALMPVIILISNAFAELMPKLTPLIEMLGGMLADAIIMLTPFLEKLMPVIMKLADSVIAALMPALDALWPVFEALIPVLDDIIPVIDIVADIIKDMAPIIALVAKLMATQFIVQIKMMGISFRAMAPILKIVSILLQALEPIVTVLSDSLDVLGTIVETVVLVAFQALWDIIGGIVSILGGVLGAVITGLVDLLDPPQPCLFEALQNVNSELETMKANMDGVARMGNMSLTPSITTATAGMNEMGTVTGGTAGSFGEGNTTSTNTIIIEGDVKDESTIDRILDTIRSDTITM